MADSKEGLGPPEKGSPAEGQPREKKPRGFAAMDEAKRRQISRKGGESVPVEKRSFSLDRELAAQAGRKGGAARGGRGAGSGNNDSDSDR